MNNFNDIIPVMSLLKSGKNTTLFFFFFTTLNNVTQNEARNLELIFNNNENYLSVPVNLF